MSKYLTTQIILLCNLCQILLDFLVTYLLKVKSTQIFSQIFTATVGLEVPAALLGKPSLG